MPPASRFYHGTLSRREAEDALREHGNNSWLIRFSENESKEIISMKRYEVQDTPKVSAFCSLQQVNKTQVDDPISQTLGRVL